MVTQKIDDSWYLALLNYSSHWYSMVAAYGGQYRNYKKFDPSVVAEKFGVTDDQIDAKQKKLRKLVRRLNEGEVLDAQRELDRL